MSAGIKISALPAASGPTAGDVFPVVQGGVTKKAALAAGSIYAGLGGYQTVGELLVAVLAFMESAGAIIQYAVPGYADDDYVL